MRSFGFHPLALRELEDSAQHYFEISDGIGRHFRQSFEAAISHVTAFPEAAPFCQGPYRAKVLRSFPYSVIYRVLDDHLRIIAVAPHARRPGYWTDRVD